MIKREENTRCICHFSFWRLLCLVFIFTLLFFTNNIAVRADSGTKNAKSRSIAIVYDNSGSMYIDQNLAWCRAIYSMEVFASMMNEGDTFQIYPMFEITVGQKTYSSQNPFTLYGGGATSGIRDIFTTNAGGTPIETILDAYTGLNQTRADEKWLIVLTDGDVFYEDGASLGRRTQSRLSEVLTEYNHSVNVLYLGIGANAVIPEVEDGSPFQYYADKASNSADVLSKLTEMCNFIFGRDVLDSTNDQLSFDVSMKKLFLFVQGSDISQVALQDSSGRSIGAPTLEYTPRYSEQGAGNYAAVSDQSLSGTIAVYDTPLDAGTYTLSYAGNPSNVEVYYEPDVDLSAVFLDEHGDEVSASEHLYSGTYSIRYCLVDKDGTPTSSALLGETHYTVDYTKNGKVESAESDSEGEISVDLAEGDTLSGGIEVSYLSGYTIARTFEDFGWPAEGISVVNRPAGALDLELTGGQETIPLSLLEQDPYSINLKYNGARLTSEELKNAGLLVERESGNIDWEIVQDGDTYLLSLRYPEPVETTECGECHLSVSASYTDPFGVTAVSEPQDIVFTVEDDGATLSVTVSGDDYFVLSDLDEGEILVKLQMDGQELTEEQLSAASVTIDGEIPCTAEPVYGASAFRVKIADSKKAVAGKYRLRITGTAEDQIGREITGRKEWGVELQHYPRWLRILSICLIVLLILASLISYMNMKVLTKRIILNNAESLFMVDGDIITGSGNCKFSGGNKKKGTLQLASPRFVSDPLVKGGVNLSLEAVSKRSVKSNRRKARVVRLSVVNQTAFQNMQIANHTLVKTMDGDGVVWVFDGKPFLSLTAIPPFEISWKTLCIYNGETQTNVEYTYKAVLQAK